MLLTIVLAVLCAILVSCGLKYYNRRLHRKIDKIDSTLDAYGILLVTIYKYKNGLCSEESLNNAISGIYKYVYKELMECGNKCMKKPNDENLDDLDSLVFQEIKRLKAMQSSSVRYN